MNKIYKVVWSRAKNCYIVVSEYAKRTGKSAQTKKLLAAFMAAGIMATGAVGIAEAEVTKDSNGNITVTDEDVQKLNALLNKADSLASVSDSAVRYERIDRNNMVGSGKVMITDEGTSIDTGYVIEYGTTWSEKFETTGIACSSIRTTTGRAAADRWNMRSYTNSWELLPGTNNLSLGYYTSAGYALQTNKDGSYKTETVNINGSSGTKNERAIYVPNTTYQYNYATALGDRTAATHFFAMAWGSASVAAGRAATAWGYNTIASGKGATAFGSSTIAAGDYSLALGVETKAQSNVGTYDSDKAKNAEAAVALGYKTTASNKYALAGGNQSTASGEGSLAFGEKAKASGTYAIALNQATASGKYAAALGKSTASGMYSLATGLSAVASGKQATAIGLQTKAIGENSFAGGQQSEAHGVNSFAFGNIAKTAEDATDAISMGNQTEANAAAAVAIGDQSKANADSSVAMGYKSETKGASSVAIGNRSKANGKSSTAIGYYSEANGDYSMALAGGVTGTDAKYSVAIGDFATTTAADSMALGYESKATVKEGTALGAYSIADRDKYSVAYKGKDVEDTVYGYDASVSNVDSVWKATSAAIAVGGTKTLYDDDDNVTGTETITRQITGVAAGTELTDAVNLAQLKSVAKDIESLSDEVAIVYTGKSKESSIKSTNAGKVNAESVVIGKGASTQSDKTKGVAIGDYARTAQNGVSIGYNVNNDTSVNGGDLTVREGTVTVGSNSGARALYSTVVGTNSVISVNNNVDDYVLFGKHLNLQGAGSVVTGAYNTVNTGGNKYYGIATNISGTGNTVTDSNGITIQGSGNTVTNAYRESSNFSIWDAYTAYKTGDYAALIKSVSQADSGAVAIIGGTNTVSNQISSSVIGYKNNLIGDTEKGNSGVFLAGYGNTLKNVSDSIVMGKSNTFENLKNVISLGSEVTAQGDDAVLIGMKAKVTGNYGIAIGGSASVTVENSVALGKDSKATADDVVSTASATIGGTTYNFAGGKAAGTVSIGSAGNERTITNVAAGRISETSTDAVNGSQLKAVEQTVSALDTRVTANEKAIAENKATIEKNAGDIAANKTAIAENKAAIEKNAGDIAANKTAIAENKAAIEKNAGDIAANKTAIAENKAAIEKNASDIAANKTAIAENKAAIEKNAGDIAANKTAIAENKAAIEKNAGDIAANKTAIAENKTAIEKNTGDIKTLDTRVKAVEEVAKKHTTVEAGDNITVTKGTNANGGEKYTVALKDEITVSKVEAGKTTIGDNGVAYDGKTYIDSEGINANGKTVRNVAAGELSASSTDAVNGSQLYAVDQKVENNTIAINKISGNVNKLGNRLNRVGAGAAALAALHPLDFDPDAKWDFAAGYGNYRGANAAAVGAFYRPNEDWMVSVGGSFGGGENMVNAGVSLKVGAGSSHVNTSKVAMAKEIKELKDVVADQSAQIEELKALVNSLVAADKALPAKEAAETEEYFTVDEVVLADHKSSGKIASRIRTAKAAPAAETAEAEAAPAEEAK